MSSRRGSVVAAIVAVQLAALVAVAFWLVRDEPTDVPVTIVAPAVVGQTLAERAAALDGPLDVTTTTSVDEARRQLRDGEVVGAVAVDLARGTDTLWLSSAQPPALRRTVQDRAAAQSASLDRSLEVETVDPRATATQRRVVDLAPVVAAALGLAGAVVLTWRRGPYATTGREGHRRFVVSLAYAVVVGGGVGVAASLLAPGSALWAVALGMLGTATYLALVQALEALLGVAGIAVATSLLLVVALPTLMGVPPAFLPGWWQDVVLWLPHGAAGDAARSVAFYGGHGLGRDLWVLGAWALTMLATVTLSRWERARDGAEPPTGVEPATSSLQVKRSTN